ncbi:MAG: type II/IV secretion system protein [Gemmatimonadaceae bacterium]|nr:type II/IV secretion system protein [Gemmatimonadaceae bacterium]
MALKMRLGDRLVENGLISSQQLEKALAKHAITGEKLGQTLVAMGFLQQDDLMKTLAADAGIPYVLLTDVEPEHSAIAIVPENIARRHTALPLRQENGRLLVAMDNPFDMEAVTAIERASGRPIKVVAAPRDSITSLLRRAYHGDLAFTPPAQTPPRAAGGQPIPPSIAPPRTAAPGPRDTRNAEPEEGASAAKLVDEIITRGTALGATDIHIEPFEEVTKVRYRLDGLLQEGATYPRALQPAIMSRIKIMSGLDIAETRLPQDGRVRIRSDGRHIDLRVSTFPTLHGEDLVLRILDRSRVSLNLERLGIEPEDLHLLRNAFHRPHGIIPVTGPTGSGKTTTLYSAMVELNNRESCIITLEDPIEYELATIRQSQINVRAGLTFPSGLRSILRHDPDTILVGEMRDAETVQIALTAALTGHLVLTTLHTNTAAGAIPRLLDMGAEPFVLASAVLLVASQRLVRVLCKECKTPTEITATVRERFGLEGVQLFGIRGCPSCRQTGYKGRIGIFEFLPITEEIVNAIYDRRPAEEIHRISGRPTLLQDGIKKVKAGITTLDELLRVTVG